LGGSARNPSWYHNIAAHPDQVWIEVAGQQLRVTAEQLDGEPREAAWQRIVESQPRYAGYQRKTDRVLPILRLSPAQNPLPPPSAGTHSGQSPVSPVLQVGELSVGGGQGRGAVGGLTAGLPPRGGAIRTACALSWANKVFVIADIVADRVQSGAHALSAA
jgi:F420H(2)-dependent quinone reductase